MVWLGEGNSLCTPNIFSKFLARKRDVVCVSVSSVSFSFVLLMFLKPLWQTNQIVCVIAEP